MFSRKAVRIDVGKTVNLLNLAEPTFPLPQSRLQKRLVQAMQCKIVLTVGRECSKQGVMNVKTQRRRMIVLIKPKNEIAGRESHPSLNRLFGRGCRPHVDV